MSIFISIHKNLLEQFGELTNIFLLGFLGVILILSVLPYLLVKPFEPFDKLKSSRTGQDLRDISKNMGDGSLRREEKVDKLQKFSNFLEPQNTNELNAARLQMMRAGYRSKNAVRMFHFLQLVLGLAGLALGGIYVLIVSLSSNLPSHNMLIYIILAGLFGFYLPKLIITWTIQKRKAEIINGFPDALDLMLVSIEAGQSLDQSINRIAKEARSTYPALADELDIVSLEVKAGKERATVLKDFALRVDIPDVTSFVATLIQSATFGTPMSESLRMYSSEMRDKRASRAEEAANKIPSKLTLATMVFTLPPMMIILIGPTIYQFIKA
jgi:tight adherence protein C